MRFEAGEVQAGLAAVFGVAPMSPFMGILSDTLGHKVFIVRSMPFPGIPASLLAIAER
ncbi:MULTISPECIES: hypothetical protein [unclassified Neisseria]|uniref:hypothetical protein n=1 Tax=unclassified Neisseria TaxID=2623750 RepID=UPI0014310A42|nr:MULTISPECIES: hypothetical protein [unclassified Neisseria]MBF0804049.1 hypothetical protein [Neisseria sp. 19428wB4_WF04]